MRRPAFLLLTLPCLLGAQAVTFDDGRLDPAWFGPAANFQPNKVLGFQWLKPGLALQGRSLRTPAWEPAAWLAGRRTEKDRAFLGRMERTLPGDLDKGLRRGLKGALPLQAAGGDSLLIARVVDAEGVADDYMAMGSFSLSVDVKLLDGSTEELLGAFHGTFRALSDEALLQQYAEWCENLGRLLARLAVQPVTRPAPATPAAVLPPPAPAVLSPSRPRPAFDLEGALARIEALRQDGLLSDEECQALRKKAIDRAR